MFKRIIDLHLAQWKDDKHRKPLLLRGARQVGKTSAVRALGKKFKYFAEINFEQLKDAITVFEKDLIPEKMVSRLSVLARVPIIPGETLLFLMRCKRHQERLLHCGIFMKCCHLFM